MEMGMEKSITYTLLYEGNHFVLRQPYFYHTDPVIWEVCGIEVHCQHLKLPVGDCIYVPEGPQAHTIEEIDLVHITGGERVRSLYIPATYKRICLQNDMFPKLESVEIDPYNSDYRVQDGMLLSKSRSHICYALAAGLQETLVLPDTVTQYDRRAFTHTRCSTIVFPNPDHMLPAACFEGSRYLETHDMVIERDHLLCLLQPLDTVYLPDEVRVLTRGCFATHQPRHLRFNGDCALYESFWKSGKKYDQLETLALGPQAKLHMEDLGHFPRLQAIHVEPGHTAGLYSQDGVLFSRSTATLLYYPPDRPGAHYTVPSEARRLATGAFQNVAQLTHVTIPEGVQLCKGVFQNCTALEDVTIKGEIDTIPAECFQGCRRLQHLHLSSGLHAVETNAFARTSVREITLLGPAVTLGKGALATEGPLTITVVDAQMHGIPGFADAVLPTTSRARLGRALTLRIVDSSGALLDQIWIPASLDFKGAAFLQRATDGQQLNFAACDTALDRIRSQQERTQYIFFRHQELTRQGRSDQGLVGYLRRASFALASRMAKEHDEQGIVYLLQQGFLSPYTIQKLIAICQQTECATALVYLVDATQERPKSHNMPL